MYMSAHVITTHKMFSIQNLLHIMGTTTKLNCHYMCQDPNNGIASESTCYQMLGTWKMLALQTRWCMLHPLKHTIWSTYTIYGHTKFQILRCGVPWGIKVKMCTQANIMLSLEYLLYVKSQDIVFSLWEVTP